MAISQFRNISNWERHDITIKANELYTLNFINSTPNYFVVTNPNMARLKIGISTLPRENAFEFKVEYNTTETLGRPHGTNNLYILNDSSIDVNVIIFSATQEFDPEILKNLNVGLEGYIIQTSTEIEGVQEGVELPVKLDTPNTARLTSIVNAVTETMNNVKNINNTVKDGGTLDNVLDNVLKSIIGTGEPGEVKNLYNILYVIGNGLADIYDILFVMAKWKNSTIKSFNGTNVTSGISMPNVAGIKINYISNDGETDIKVIMTKDNRQYPCILKAGEVLSNYTIEGGICNISLTPITEGQTFSYRALFDVI